jgi:predicted Zn-dependent protease
MSPIGLGRGGFGGGRIMAAIVIAIISVLGYFGSRQFNPVTKENQHVSMSVDQEIAMGLQAAPELAAQYGGLHADPEARALVERVGRRVVEQSSAKDTPYNYEFHLLADENTINAFALPGGQVFITAALAGRLRTEAELAGVLGHEVGHVVARHAAEHLAKAELTQGLTGAAVIATYDPNDPGSRNSAAVVAAIAQLVNMKFGRDDELESDRLGVRFESEAGYDPRAMLGVMEILSEASQGQAPPEFFSTHPNPERRMERIQQAIQEQFPNGVPEGLEK